MLKISRRFLVVGMASLLLAGPVHATPYFRGMFCVANGWNTGYPRKVNCFTTRAINLSAMVRANFSEEEVFSELESFVHAYGPIALLNLEYGNDPQVSGFLARYWENRLLNVPSRILGAEDASLFKKLRLRALEKSGHCFSASLEKEAAMTLAEWAAKSAQTDQKASFGAFYEGDMVGMCSAEQWIEDSTGKTVKWGSAYVESVFAKSGIYKDLCVLRKTWSTEKGYNKAIFAIRADNARSREVNEKHGARVFREDFMRYADHSAAPRCWFEKDLD